MKSRFGAYATLIIGLAVLLAACGGGGGGGGGGVTIPVTASGSNPYLNGSTVTITANFTNYTSTARFGANAAKVGKAVTFTATPTASPTPLATLSNQTAVKADFTATVDVTGQDNTYKVAATLNAASGSTDVTFIPQPFSASVIVSSQKAYTGLGGLTCTVASEIPAIFRKYSSASTAFQPDASNPTAGSLPFTVSSVAPLWATGTSFDVAANATLVNLLYNMNYDPTPLPPLGTPGVPHFAVGSIEATLASPITLIDPPPPLVLKTTYFSGLNGAGTKLYTTP